MLWIIGGIVVCVFAVAAFYDFKDRHLRRLDQSIGTPIKEPDADDWARYGSPPGSPGDTGSLGNVLGM